MTQKYRDIIDRPHPTSERHPRMSMIDRAAQFSPFSALVGYEEAVAESGRLTQSLGETDQNEKELLDRKLCYLRDHGGARITVTYFRPDDRKEGGAFYETEDVVLCVDPLQQMLITEKTHIPLKYIRELIIDGIDL